MVIEAFHQLKRLVDAWHEVDASDSLRETAVRFLRVHLSVQATPAIGDVNRHGVADVTVGDLGQTVLSVRENGASNPGYPYLALDSVFSSPTRRVVAGESFRRRSIAATIASIRSSRCTKACPCVTSPGKT